MSKLLNYAVATIKNAIVDLGIYDAIVQRNSILLEAEGEEVDIYAKKSSGDTCPEKTSLEQQSNAKCYICFGTGYLTGYDKYRYRTETLEVTDSNSTITVSLTGVEAYRGRDFVWGQLETGTLTGKAESGWIGASDALTGAGDTVGEKGIKTVYVTQATSTDVKTYYSVDGVNWIDESSFENETITPGFQFKIRVKLSRGSTSEESPQWCCTRIRYKNDSASAVKVLKETSVEKIRFARDGLFVENRPPLWTGPTPVINDGDFIYFKESRKLNIISNLDPTTLGPTNQLVMQNFDSADMPDGDPKQKLIWE